MNSEVIILSGLSGVGKSTYAQKLCASRPNSSKIVSSDTYFMREGRYAFDPTKLGEAHKFCFRSFLSALLSPDLHLVVVDNTNTTIEEVAPYVLAAESFDWEVEIITLRSRWPEFAKLAARNVHRVPEAAIAAQDSKLRARNFPDLWNQSTIFMD